ncbi:MAG: hypothetical protein H7281_15085 [Bacteriovorax sp.]|nr:hypothetical protein [Bacteriovorax sp.]
MHNESQLEEVVKTSKAGKLTKNLNLNTAIEIKHRYIYSRKDDKDETANLIDELLIRCNQKDYGAVIEFSSLVAHALKLLKESDIAEIQNSSLSDEDRANEEVRKFNHKHGTNYTMFEFVLNGLQKKSKKGVNQ